MPTTTKMSLLGLALLLGGCAGLPGGLPSEESAHNLAGSATQIVDGRGTTPPPGFVSFCMHNAALCAGSQAPEPQKVVLDDQKRAVLMAVNDQINRAIAYRGDPQNFGIANIWRLDAVGGSGDCKDYALAKQQALIAAGLPKEALRLAIVKTPRDELHAVLTVDTDRGDFVLDSIDPAILPWSETSYDWLSRQSADNPLQWLSLARRG
jgi:predicted transglutaminase-like cysteine proteinase